MTNRPHAVPDIVECVRCGALFQLEHYRLGMRLPCPACHRDQVPRLVRSGFFWWDVTFGDFRGLLQGADTSESTSRRVLDWLGWTLDRQGEEAFFVDGTGRRHSLEAAHLLIQRTPEWQFDLYQMAMDFWR